MSPPAVPAPLRSTLVADDSDVTRKDFIQRPRPKEPGRRRRTVHGGQFFNPKATEYPRYVKQSRLIPIELR